MKEPPNENLHHANRQAMNRKWEDVLVFGLADHRDGHPPYESDNDEGGICRIIGGFGCRAGHTFLR
ncbi:hypothetical protein [Nitrosomonas sp. Is79A3]|uniref:hypothetical protein n=1 Tax=Nitrosomonas sp. (strain Is79A3) TaxID=261292 RepID=UPI000300C919